MTRRCVPLDVMLADVLTICSAWAELRRTLCCFWMDTGADLWPSYWAPVSKPFSSKFVTFSFVLCRHGLFWCIDLGDLCCPWYCCTGHLVIWCRAVSFVSKPFWVEFEELNWVYDVVEWRDSTRNFRESNAARFAVYGTPESGGGGKEEARGQSYFRGDKWRDNTPLGHVSQQIKSGR